jgi:hypothetical protein
VKPCAKGDGREPHTYSPDLEYDHANPPITCERCGERRDRRAEARVKVGLAATAKAVAEFSAHDEVTIFYLLPNPKQLHGVPTVVALCTNEEQIQAVLSAHDAEPSRLVRADYMKKVTRH